MFVGVSCRLGPVDVRPPTASSSHGHLSRAAFHRCRQTSHEGRSVGGWPGHNHPRHAASGDYATRRGDDVTRRRRDGSGRAEGRTVGRRTRRAERCDVGARRRAEGRG